MGQGGDGLTCRGLVGMIGLGGFRVCFSIPEGILETFSPLPMSAFIISSGPSEALALVKRTVAREPIVFDFGSGGGRGCISLCWVICVLLGIPEGVGNRD